MVLTKTCVIHRFQGYSYPIQNHLNQCFTVVKKPFNNKFNLITNCLSRVNRDIYARIIWKKKNFSIIKSFFVLTNPF